MGGPGSGRDRPDALAALERAREVSPPETAAVSHGLNVGSWLPCDRCIMRDRCPHYQEGEECALEQAYFADRVRHLAGSEGVDPELDMPLVTAAVWAEVRAARGRRFLAAVGEFRADKLAEDLLEYQPAASEVRLLQKEARDAIKALGLAPSDRKGTGDGPDLGQLVKAAEELERQDREEAATDAEFDAEDA